MTLKPIGHVLSEVAAEDPGRPAITCAGRTASRAELDFRSNRLARAYRGMGVQRGDLVTIGLPNGIEFYEATFATWKLGATPQPLSPRLPVPERNEIVRLANPALVVGVDGDEGGRRSVPQGFEPEPKHSGEPLPDVVAPSLRAMTSGGSTGRPKLIVSSLAGLFDRDTPPMGLAPHQTALVAGPLYHTSPFANSTNGLLLGQHIIVLEQFDAELALSTIEQERINWMLLVPTMMLRMLRVINARPRRYDLGSVEVFWHMGAPCPAWLKDAWIELIGPESIFELYSGTETQAIATISGTEWQQHRGSVGRTTVGETKIVDAEGNEVDPGTVGEIFMRRGEGLNAPYHYLGSEARKLIGGWESIGDMGFKDVDGYLFIVDRRTDMILSGGANVYPAEVENIILEHPRVLSCAVVGLPDEDLGQRVHAVVQSQGPLEEDVLRTFVGDRLVRYKVPRSFRFVNESLRDDAGKVRRSSIRSHEIALAGEATVN